MLILNVFICLLFLSIKCLKDVNFFFSLRETEQNRFSLDSVQFKTNDFVWPNAGSLVSFHERASLHSLDLA